MVGVAVGKGVGVGVGVGVGGGVDVGSGCGVRETRGVGVGVLVRSTCEKQAGKTSNNAVKARTAPLSFIKRDPTINISDLRD